MYTYKVDVLNGMGFSNISKEDTSKAIQEVIRDNCIRVTYPNGFVVEIVVNKGTPFVELHTSHKLIQKMDGSSLVLFEEVKSFS